MSLVLVPQHARLGEGFSLQERATGLEHPGRRTDGVQTAASWITDLTDLRKTIILCGWCRGHFNPRRHGYRRRFVADLTGKTDGYEVTGRCSACKQPTINTPGNGVAFMPEEAFAEVCIDPAVARRRARAAAATAWQSAPISARMRALTQFLRGSRRPFEAPAHKGA